MTEFTLLNSYAPQCRYCLEDNQEGLIAPCKCSGSSKYVHKQCLIQWFESKNNRVVVPGMFNQFDIFKCEVCQTKYRCKYEETEHKPLWKPILVYFTAVTVSLVASYIGVGLLMQLSPTTSTMFYSMKEYGKWANILWSGFCMTHLILGIFYILVSIILFTSRGSCGCYCIYCGDCNGGGNCEGNDDCGIIIVFVIIAIGVMLTVALIYTDMISRVVQRHHNSCKKIVDIKDLYCEEV